MNPGERKGLALGHTLTELKIKCEFSEAYSNAYFSLSAAAAKSLQSCPTLCNPIDGSPPGSSIHGILQARVLKWGAIAFFI